MKEKKINLVEILKNCPKGTILYSTIHGNVEFEGIDIGDEYTIKVAAACNGNRIPAWFTSDGRYFRYYLEGDCVLFPSKDCRDWSKFKIEDSVNISERVAPIKFNKVKHKTMDYEKLYKEALERAKHFQEVNGSAVITAIFPELNESEDEKIRKSLIDMLKNDEKCYLKEIAWLEKQKPQQTPQWMIDFLDANRIKFASAIEDDYDFVREAEGKIIAIINWLENHSGQSFNVQWHDANEEPEEMREIFCEWESQDATWHDIVFYHADTKAFVCIGRKVEGIVKWAYVKELLEMSREG